MITETPILAEFLCAMRAPYFRCNQNFRDHVRADAAAVARLAGLLGVACVTGEFALLARPAAPMRLG
jgi:hypothetical protein